MAVLVIAVVLAIVIALSLTLGAGWIALPLALLLGIAAWGVFAISGRRPSSVVRNAEKPELLGPGGPDDPEANRR